MSLANLLLLICNSITALNVVILNILLLKADRRKNDDVDKKPNENDDYDIPIDDDLSD